MNNTLFSQLVETSRELPGNRWSIGGNAPVMAGRMAAEGCDVLLGGSFSPDFADILSQHITGTHTHTRNTSLLDAIPHPPPTPSVSPVAGNVVEEPDIHLILEYPSGATWGQYTARRANRCVLILEGVR